MFSTKQREFLDNANRRWNIKYGATRSGKTYLDYYVIPKRIRNVKEKVKFRCQKVSCFFFFALKFAIIGKESETMATKYDADSIKILEGLEAVRKRPGMYIGSTSARGLHHLVWEIVDNAIDEALAGYCDDIEIIVNKDESVTVKDDGRGIPTGIHPKTGISTVETVYTVLHAGGKFGGGGYKVSGGLHGVGASVVNALSSWVEVKVYQDGKIYFIRFENGGKAVDRLKVIGECDPERTGTTVTFKPDPTIFTETTSFDYETLKERVRELAFLNKGLRIILCDDRNEAEKKREEFVYEGGLSEYVKYLNNSKTPIHESIIHIGGIENDISIEAALQYNTGYSASVYSFVNNIHTPEGGTHEDGVRMALTRVLNNYARKNNILKEKDDNLSSEGSMQSYSMAYAGRVNSAFSSPGMVLYIAICTSSGRDELIP